MVNVIAYRAVKAGEMLQREKGKKPLKLMGFLGCIELEEGGPSTEEICNRLIDAVKYLEGIGQSDFECLGEVHTESDDIGVSISE